MGHICHWDDGRVSFWTSWIILLIHIYATSWINTSKKMFRKSRMTKTMMPPNRDGRLKMGKVLSIMAISLLSFPQRFLSFCFSDLFHSSLCYLYTQSNFFNTIQQIGKNTAIKKLNRSENVSSLLISVSDFEIILFKPDWMEIDPDIELSNSPT